KEPFRNRLAGRRSVWRRRLTYRFAIRLFAGFHGFGKVVALAADGILALLNPVIGRFFEFPASLFQEFRAFLGLVFDQSPRLFAGFRRKQDTDPNTDAQSEQKAAQVAPIHFCFLLEFESEFTVYRLRSLVHSQQTCGGKLWYSPCSNEESASGSTPTGCGNTPSVRWPGARIPSASC